MKKYKSKLIPIANIVLFIILTGAVIVQSLQIAALTHMIANERQARTWDAKLIFACYNNKVYPCDEETISKWNEQNPNKAITEAYLRDPEF